MAKANWPFFPLYPALSHIIQAVFHISTLWAELDLNLVLWPVLIYLCHREMTGRGIGVDRTGFALFCVIYPFNVWYTAQYSEGVFGILLISILIALQRNAVPWAAFLCFLLSLSRPTGFVAASLIAGWWTGRQMDMKNISSTWKKLVSPLQESALLLSAAGAGLSIFVFYLLHVTGDGFAFSHVEATWNRHFRFLPLGIIHDIKQRHNHRIEFFIFFIGACYFSYRMIRMKWDLSALILLPIMFIAASTGLQSIERYAFSNPLMMEFLAFLVLSKPMKTQSKILTILFILHIVVIELWFHRNILLI
ncbi:hypothetical protein [Komagataeibacter sp. FNDCR2]|uniref:hypothetical protein n=1 Tax=Komagataeibacter sp. FNDCR2 TaxID=2878682 RepID=UPI001E37708C|nr:hypothetical protein [Komagataeibacter sp. FNDCR2]MCE2575920.1 hypothetical protein [Komagataeibacter sp. FNDCR2]